MPIIVKHKSSERTYVLLVTGISEFKSSHPGAVMGALNPVVEQGRASQLAVCDEHGRIFWFDSDEMYVATVDGVQPHECLKRLKEIEVESPPVSDGTSQASDEDIDSYLEQTQRRIP